MSFIFYLIFSVSTRLPLQFFRVKDTDGCSIGEHI
jgi:hypothetical protein